MTAGAATSAAGVAQRRPAEGRLQGRVAVVTGGASGIGEATVRRFAAEGASVVIADVQDARGQALAAELGTCAVHMSTDVTDEDALAAAVACAVERFGRIDVMYNNAGIIGATGPIASLDRADYARTMAVLFDSVVLGTKHAAAAMLSQGDGGVILSTSSVAALAGGMGAHTYSAAKAAVIGFTQSVAAELWPHGIRVNAIVPGKIATPMTDELRARNGLAPGAADSDDVMRAERRALPAQIAAAAAFLASDDAAFVTGETLLVDGGLVRAGGPSPFAIGLYAQPGMIGRSGLAASGTPVADPIGATR